jgi:type 1 fimbria pilin
MPGNKRAARWLSILSLLAFINTDAMANIQVTQITVKVNVMATPPCVINNNAPIEVDFGSALDTSKVDGSNYTKPINYSLDCSGSSLDNLKIRIVGGSASSDNGLLSTDKDNLAIGINNGSASWPINTWLNFTSGNQPSLSAVPIKERPGRLFGGPFSASATMTVGYQ